MRFFALPLPKRQTGGAGAGGTKRLFGGSLFLLGILAIAAVVASNFSVMPAHGASGSDDAGFTESGSGTTAAPEATTQTSAAASSPAAAPSTPFLMPLIPVISFWSAPRSLALADVVGLWAGLAGASASAGFSSVAVEDTAVDPLTRAFGIPAESVRALSAAGVKAAVRDSPSTLGLLAVDDVTPDVRALAVDGVSLFGSARLKDVARWPLMVPSASATAFTTGSVWTLAAGGDVNLDRAVYVKAVSLGYGPDFPWSGGNARVASYTCCGWQGAPIAVARNTGGDGAFGERFSEADLAVVNLEGSAPNDFVYRANSLVFTFDPALLAGLRDAGIDAVSLANNHIRNGGDKGVLETCQNLDAVGIAHAGAAADATAARQPAWLHADGLNVALLAYSAVGPANWAGADSPGAARLDVASVTADIKAARAAGADIVIVMPHWGQEYSYSLTSAQKSDAAAFVAAGADLVLGSHSHWVGAIQSLEGPNGPAFIDYSLGDLIFDLEHDVASQEGVIATMTFSGKRLVQVTLDPTVIIGGAQAALLDPAGDGKRVIDAIRAASKRLIDW